MLRFLPVLRCAAPATPLRCQTRAEGPDEPINPEARQAGKSRLVFTGSGNSTGTPRPMCLMGMQDHPGCVVSRLSMQGAPDRNRNYRGNPGMLIQYEAPDGVIRNIQIDTGKTYREAVLRWYPRFRVPWLDAVILTHDHADACLGLDELRTVQRVPEAVEGNRETIALQRDQIPALPVYLGCRHMPHIRKVFSYMMPQPNASVKRFVAKVDWIEVNDFETFECPGGLKVTTLPLEHGRNYICLGFLFGDEERVAYLSDVSTVPEDTYAYLEKESLSLLVVDCLYECTHAVHFGFNDAVNLVRRLRPRKALFIGMSDAFEHHATNLRLKEMFANEGIDVQLAYDGLHLDMTL